MATNGTVYTGYARNSRYYLDWQIAETDIANNRTKINWQAGIANGNYWYLNAMKIYTIYIDGVAVSSGGTFSNNEKQGKTQYLSGSTWINHSSDGSKSFSISLSGWFYNQGNVSGSDSFTLPTIPRASATRLSSSSVNMGSSVTVYTDRASSSFTHYFYYRIGSGSWNLVATGIGDYYTWTVPLSLASNVPSGTSLSITVNIDTYNGSTKIGSTFNTLTCYVPSSVVPSVSGITVADANGYANTFGGYVQDKSVPKITVNASASYSSISQYKVSFQGNSYISSSNVITLGAISQTGSLNITVTVTDARGRTASKTVSITGLAYTAPSLSTSAIRCDSDGTANDDGSYMKISCMVSITSLNNKNSKTVTLKYKKKSVSDWTTQKTWTEYSVNENVIVAADTDSSYDIQLTAVDYFNSSNPAVHNTVLGTVAVIMDFNASGKGMAIGKVSEQDGLEIEWDLKVNGQMIPREITDNTDLNTIVESGTYVCYTNATAGTLANCPTNKAFSLEVLRAALGGGSYNNVVQRITTYHPTTTTEYRRTIYAGEYGAWKLVPSGLVRNAIYEPFTSTTSWSYTGYSITIPAGCLYGMEVKAIYSNSCPSGVAIAYQNDNANTFIAWMDDWDGWCYEPTVTYTGYTASTITRYIWTRYHSSASNRIAGNFWYMPVP